MKTLITLSLLLFVAARAHAFIVYGKAVSIGKGEARAYADIDNLGTPRSVGLAISEKSMEGLSDQEMEFPLELPSILKIAPYDHMVINWEPHGHVPEHIYTVPHFDFHFYFISEAQRKSIQCTGADTSVCKTQPDPSKIPAHYVPSPDGVPQMGWHWVDPRSPEFNGKMFTATFIYGFYGGHMIFLEPMVTRAFLMENKNFEKEIPAPEAWPKNGYYPKSYSIRYDSFLRMHFIGLRNLELKK
ncbi:MAG: DUF5602 domain-containing protein [Pseudobdellovibrionaceae bacterium]